MRKLIEKCSTLNSAKGIEDDSIGAYKVYSAYGLYAIDKIMNEGQATKRLFGLDTPKKCMEYLNTL